MKESIDIVPDIARIQPSATLSVAARAAELRAQGVDVLDLSAGEPDCPPPPAVREITARLVAESRMPYTPVPGMPSLRDAVAEQLSAYHGISLVRDEILVSCGAKHSLANLFRVTLDAGDEVVVLAPYWSSYPEMVRLAGGTPVVATSRREDGWKVRPEVLEPLLGPRTRYVLVNSPGNPTGAGLGADDLREIGTLLATRAPRAWMIVDDIYRRIAYGDYRHVSAYRVLEGIFDRIVVIDGVSKSHAMTGYRIGFLAAPAPVIRAASKVQGQTTSGAATPSQHAAYVAITDPTCDSAVEAMCSTFARRRASMLERLAAMPNVAAHPPEGAFYLFVEVTAHCGPGKAHADDVRLATWLLEQKQVAVVPGTAFGAPGYLRLSYAADDAILDEAMARIGAALAFGG